MNSGVSPAMPARFYVMFVAILVSWAAVLWRGPLIYLAVVAFAAWVVLLARDSIRDSRSP